METDWPSGAVVVRYARALSGALGVEEFSRILET